MPWKHEELKFPGYEKVVYAEERDTGLRAIISVHSTALGPACGGIRMLPYASRNEALEDVLRLSKGMSYKSSLAGIGFGGGKSVILGDPSRKTPALFQAMGSFIDTFAGKYFGAKDMNVTSEDLLEARKITRYVLGLEGVPGSSGDPSPVTARGVLRALEATLEETHGTKSLKGVKVAIQGIGYVGYPLAERIREGGGELWVTDMNEAALDKAKRELGAKVVPLDAIYDVECDIFSPCARGAILNAETIPRLKCRAIVGCANNQLKDESCGHALEKRGILYAPDYAVNAGGIINIFYELGGSYDERKAFAKADEIYTTMKEIFRRSKAEKLPPFLLADKLAEERIRAAR
jgi:leucine dehydrogenase